MPKKIINLFQSSVNKFYKQNIFIYSKRIGKEFKYRTPEHKKSKKDYYFKRVPEPLLNILRYLKISIYSNKYPKIALFWKAFLTRLLRERFSKTTLVALKDAANEVVVSPQTRGLGSTSRKMSDTLKPAPSNQLNKSDKFIKARSETPAPKHNKELNNEEKQKSKEEPYQEKLFFNLESWKRVEEISNTELPPPQVCRLSCPLPPPEFRSYEMNEFRSNYLSPNVRFSSLPMDFLPEANQNISSPKDLLPNVVTTSSVDSYNDLEIESTVQNIPPFAQSYDSLTQDLPTMKALLFEPATLKLKYETVNAPVKIFKDEVLVQVAYSGVCSTDLFMTEGRVSCGRNQIILGHEISGRVYAVGKEVNHVMPGDKIAVNAYTACSFCRYCTRGMFSSCLNEGLNNSIGISKDGGWAEFVVVKKSQVYKIPDELELNQAALIQPLSCVLRAMSKLKILHEMDILIMGLGLSGSLWASVLHSQGYKNVFVSDKVTRRVSQFESLGTNYATIPPEDIIRYSVDVVVECTGSPNSMQKSLNILNSNGQICFFGIPHPNIEVRCMPYEIIHKEITIVGNIGNTFHFSKAINVANAMGQRYLDFEKLGVKIFDLENYKEAFGEKKSGEASKIIFKIDS